MIVLCVDPGLANLGWAVMNVPLGSVAHPYPPPSFVCAGVQRTRGLPKAKRLELGVSKIDDKSRRVQELADFLDGLIKDMAPSVLAHEAQSLGFHQSLTLFDMGLAFGAMLGVARAHRLDVISATPQEVKRRVCANPKADKLEVIEWAKRTYPKQGWPKATLLHEHQADAMAVGYTLAERMRRDALSLGSLGPSSEPRP